MRKLIMVTTLVFTLGIGCAAFAAANPFSDVPANHWAYKAILDLQKNGVIDGYGDGSFKGDKVITRYEMSQIVAKAMNHLDKADENSKGQLLKLQAEFAAELQNLGVRVENLEKNQSKIKFSGDGRIRFLNNGDSVLNSNPATPAQSLQERFRLYMTAKVADNVEANASFVAVGQSTDQESRPNYDTQLGRFNLKFKEVGPLKDITVGRFAPAFSGSDYTQLIFSPGTIGGDGVGVSFENGKLKGNANYIDYRDYVGDYR